MAYRTSYSSGSYTRSPATRTPGRSGFSYPRQTSTTLGKDIMGGLQTIPLQKIQRPVSLASDVEVVCRDVEYIASYNWTDSDEPTIIVPGSPRVWTDKALPVRVSRDNGTAYIDQNAYRIPTYPLLPLFRAASIMDETRRNKVNWGMVDVVTDRNNLRKLLSWVEGSNDDFRIDVQLCGTRTLLLQRWEPRTTEDGRQGYGESFERTMTRPAPGCERGTLSGHHRVIKYDFGSLKLVVRCEVDACYPAPVAGASRALESDNTSSSDLDDLLTNGLSSLSFSGNNTSRTTDLHIIRAGKEVPQSNLIKIKTRSYQGIDTYDWSSAYPQLLLGQTTTTLIGVHNRGEFLEVRKTRLDSPQLRVHKANTQAGLKKLRKLLETIRRALQGEADKTAHSLVCQDGVLQLMKRTSRASLLPSAEFAKHF